MKTGDLVKMKEPDSQYGWRVGASRGIGIVLKAPHRTKRTMRACTVYWCDHPYPDANKRTVQEIVEEWLEVLSESR